MRKNSYGRILKEEPKEQHLSIVPKSCSNLKIIDSLSYFFFKLFKKSCKNVISLSIF